LTPSIRRWIYLGTVFAPTAIPLMAYAMIIAGAFIVIFIFIRAYQNFVFTTDPTVELLEMGRRSLRRGSLIIAQGQQKILHHRDSYHLLKSPSKYNHHTGHNNKNHNIHYITSSSNDDEDSAP
jgi:scavenger receptor class B protein 1